MNDRKLRDSLSNLDKAVSNLERALTLPADHELVREGTILRFEIAAELTWKTLKRALEFQGASPKTPRESLKQAFAAGWLDDEASWLDMLDFRNMTSHIDLVEEFVEQADAEIARLTPAIRSLVERLKSRLDAAEPGGVTPA